MVHQQLNSWPMMRQLKQRITASLLKRQARWQVIAPHSSVCTPFMFWFILPHIVFPQALAVRTFLTLSTTFNVRSLPRPVLRCNKSADPRQCHSGPPFIINPKHETQMELCPAKGFCQRSSSRVLDICSEMEADRSTARRVPPMGKVDELIES